MRRPQINALLNTCGFLALLVTLISGVVMLWGPGGGRGQTFLGLTRDIWLDIHAPAALIFVGLIAIHLILHWYWIKNLPRIVKG